MLMFFAILIASVAAVFLAQALDIEGVNAPKHPVARSRKAPAKAEATFANGSIAGAAHQL